MPKQNEILTIDISSPEDICRLHTSWQCKFISLDKGNCDGSSAISLNFGSCRILTLKGHKSLLHLKFLPHRIMLIGNQVGQIAIRAKSSGSMLVPKSLFFLPYEEVDLELCRQFRIYIIEMPAELFARWLTKFGEKRETSHLLGASELGIEISGLHGLGVIIESFLHAYKANLGSSRVSEELSNAIESMVVGHAAAALVAASGIRIGNSRALCRKQ